MRTCAIGVHRREGLQRRDFYPLMFQVLEKIRQKQKLPE